MSDMMTSLDMHTQRCMREGSPRADSRFLACASWSAAHISSTVSPTVCASIACGAAGAAPWGQPRGPASSGYAGYAKIRGAGARLVERRLSDGELRRVAGVGLLQRGGAARALPRELLRGGVGGREGRAGSEEGGVRARGGR